MNFSLNITECFSNCCCCKIREKEYTFSNSTSVIFLNNGYNLSIISVTSDSIIVRIENGNEIFIRVISSNYPFELCIATNNCHYYLRIILTFN